MFVFQSDVLKKEQQLVKDAAEFLLVHQIPAFVSSSGLVDKNLNLKYKVSVISTIGPDKYF